MHSKEESKEQLKLLVETFRDNLEQYQKSTYKEAQVRIEFIDKFFKCLGWDVDNKQGFAEQYKEVINEDSIKIAGKTKAPDYAFRIGNIRKFFVEAKKPAKNIKENSESSFQLRRYAWNTKIPLSILTDFDEFAVYDCRIKPKIDDKSSVGRIMYLTFEDYVNKFDELYNLFSKQAILKGSFDRYVEENKGKKGTSEVDNDFLKQIEKWREYLAKNIAIKNSDLNIYELNYCIQTILDRIIFLRIAEDREIEQYGKLKEISQMEKVYINLLDYFKKADDKYNSSLFDLKKDKLTVHLFVDDKILKPIIEDLYYPKSPYDFSVLSVEILGSVYEKFLGKTVRLTASHQAKVEEKLEVRKAGGIYYTPEFVVDYIVKNTVGKLIENKTPKQIEKIKILDPACGSGTFLVRAYSYLLQHHLDYYLKNPKKFKKEIYQVKENQWFLATEIRKKILLNNIFGVDIDPQAVGITKLSLLLKVLENETKESVNQQLKLFQERALPNLDSNIKCGNSVVDSSYFYQNKLADNIDNLKRINPFDWEDEQKGFGRILNEGKFDAIIGNPPYVKEDVNRKIFEDVKKTKLKKYYQGKMDFWQFFTCKALDLLKEEGLHSYIAPSSWITNMGASNLRNKILTDSKITSFFDFNDFKVFKDASIQTMIFVLKKSSNNKNHLADYHKILNKNVSKEELRNYLLTGKDGKDFEHFKTKINSKEKMNKTITFINPKFNYILEKIRQKSNYNLKDKDIGNGIDVLQDFVKDTHLKVLKDLNLKKGDGIFILNKEEIKKINFNKTEFEKIKPYYTSKQLKKYFGNTKNDYWIIYADVDVRSNITKYPNIKNHLNKFKKVLTSVFRPYGLHRPREQRFFEGEKIFSLRKTKEVSFTYTNFSCYVSRAFLIIKPENINLKYLTGFLNSNIIHFWLKFKGKRQGEQLQIDKAPLLELPIYHNKKQDKEETIIENEIIKLTESTIDCIKRIEKVRLDSEKSLLEKQCATFQKKIDDLIYKLYGITEKEKKIIEESLDK